MPPSINTPDRQAEAFPLLTPAQIDRIRPYGTERTVRAREILFEAGDLGIPCFIVLSGKLDAVIRGSPANTYLRPMVREIFQETWS
jgi:CRP-like cAMP-binding protein